MTGYCQLFVSGSYLTVVDRRATSQQRGHVLVVQAVQGQFPGPPVFDDPRRPQIPQLMRHHGNAHPDGFGQLADAQLAQRQSQQQAQPGCVAQGLEKVGMLRNTPRSRQVGPHGINRSSSVATGVAAVVMILMQVHFHVAIFEQLFKYNQKGRPRPGAGPASGADRSGRSIRTAAARRACLSGRRRRPRRQRPSASCSGPGRHTTR